ncbi:MAG: hypothetical protein KGZ63_12950 [Clostridiales bacterium]|jgi:hypothetical protein|nr:hypothetical protein [Clostridiales bacterium]
MKKAVVSSFDPFFWMTIILLAIILGEIQGRSENWARVTFYQAKIKLQERIEGDEY